LEFPAVERIKIRALGGLRGAFICRRLMYVRPRERAPASCVPSGIRFEGRGWVRRACRFWVTLVFTRLKARYIIVLSGWSTVVDCLGGSTTLCAGDVGWRNFAMKGVAAMTEAVFWWERDRWALTRRSRVERREGREIAVA